MIATDWINGRRTPDANQLLEGTIAGFTLGTKAPQVFRALVEATAFGTKAIVDRFVEEGVHIDDVIGIGGIALKSPFVMQTMSDVLGMPIKVCKTDQACALGAAMFAATAAGVYAKVEDAIAAMNSGFSYEYQPNAANTAAYQKLYAKYLKLGQFTERQLFC
jgi:L-ribulokinase